MSEGTVHTVLEWGSLMNINTMLGCTVQYCTVQYSENGHLLRWLTNGHEVYVQYCTLQYDCIHHPACMPQS